MNQRIHITTKVFAWTAVLGSLLILSLVTINALLVAQKTSEATDEAVSAVSSFYLKSMADRRAKTITNLISNNFEEMEKAVVLIEDKQVNTQDELRDMIGKVEFLLGLSRFALVDEDNIVYTQYTTYTGGSRHEFLAEDKIEERTISTVSIYGSSKQMCQAIPTPDLVIMGKQFKACFVQLDITDIVDLLAFDDQSSTSFALYSKSGGNISGTELGPVIANHNILDAIKAVVPEDEWEKNCQNFANEAEGNITFNSGEASETLYYVPIPDTGWEMAVLIRKSVIQDQIRDISERSLRSSKNQIAFTLISVLTLAVVLLLEIRQLSKEKLEAEKEASRTFRDMATTDALTGVRNKHAYSENEAALNQQIQAGELEKLAVVVGDINGLKYVNDTQGHAAGDQLIKDACAMICEHFTHGAVFRIGGDEFAVLLQGKGYDTMLEVIGELNRKIEANIADNAVVISLGYSVLRQEDQQVRDIFERADQMMYERKKELKAMGAVTSRM